MNQSQPEHQAAAPMIDFTAWLENLRRDVSETVNGITLRGARAVPIGATANATSRPTSAAGALLGWSLTASAAGTVRFYDGTNNAADLAAVADIPGDRSALTAWFGPGGINLTRGLFVEIDDAAGLEGVVYLRGVD